MNPPALVNPHEKTGHSENAGGSDGAKCGALGAGISAKSPPDDPDLVAIVGAWPTLAPAIRAGVLALVRAGGAR
ncbi:MAG: hypothetical protein J0L78_00550 [Planctomycetes bacterium]|nr:hypothetical protein [Planctomycetota bacterium]